MNGVDCAGKSRKKKTVNTCGKDIGISIFIHIWSMGMSLS
jgi:hypothetical protein